MSKALLMAIGGLIMCLIGLLTAENESQIVGSVVIGNVWLVGALLSIKD